MIWYLVAPSGSILTTPYEWIGCVAVQSLNDEYNFFFLMRENKNLGKIKQLKSKCGEQEAGLKARTTIRNGCSFWRVPLAARVTAAARLTSNEEIKSV